MLNQYEKEREYHKDILQDGKKDYAVMRSNIDRLMKYWNQHKEIGGKKIDNFWHAKAVAKKIAHRHGHIRQISKFDQQLVFKEIVLSNRRELVQKMVDLALEGDTDMIKVLSERGLLPAKQTDNYIDVDMRGTAKEISDRVMEGVGAGEILPGEGQKLMDMLRTATDMTTMQEISDKIDKIQNTLPS